MNWEPAETVPRDGSQFLACLFTGAQEVIRWNVQEEWFETSWCELLEESWVTHWMPLPPRP